MTDNAHPLENSRGCCGDNMPMDLGDDFLHGRTLLVVDDEPINLLLLRETLKESGLNVIQANCGEEALKIACTELPDLILMDVMMPNLDGFNACRCLKADPQTYEIPVIFITALSELQDKMKGFEAGGVDYIIKPFQKQEVQARVALHIKMRLMQRQLQEKTERLAEEVAECKRLEGELSKFYRALEQASISIFITDTQGRIEFANKAFTEQTGYTLFEVLGNTPKMIKSGINPPKHYQDLWKTILAGQSWQGELINRRKDGSLYWDYLTISPLRNQAGELSHFLAIRKDISDRKQMEETLRRSEEKRQFHIQQTTQVYVEWDHNLCVTDWNPAAERLFGYNKHEVLHRRAFELVLPPEGDEAAEALWHSLLAATPDVILTCDSITKDGKRVRCEWYNTPLTSENGEVIGVISLAHEVEAESQ